MDPDSSVLQIILPFIGFSLLGVLLVAFAAAAEMAFASVNRAQLRRALASHRSRAQLADALLSEPARLLSTFLLLKACGYVLATAGAIFLGLSLGLGSVGWWLLGVLALLLLAQLLPRAWTVGRQERMAAFLLPLVRVFVVLLGPFTALLRRIGGAAAPAGSSQESIFLSEDGLRFLMNVGDEDNVIEDEEKEMIASIFEFSDKLVREVMVPRIDVSAVPVDMPMLEALDVILKAGHSRIPAYRASVDNVVGILYAKDLLRYLRDGRTDVPLEKILRPAYFIPESKKVNDLLAEMQQRRVHMSVVVDEYGGTAGLVTIEDLLEEIVGEIQDEFDAEEPTVEPVGEHEFMFDARVPLDEVEKLLGLELPDEGGETLGGFIYSQLGKVPAVGDRIEWDGATIEVVSVAGRRIKQVRAVAVAPEENGTASGRAATKADGESSAGAPGLFNLLMH